MNANNNIELSELISLKLACREEKNEVQGTHRWSHQEISPLSVL